MDDPGPRPRVPEHGLESPFGPDPGMGGMGGDTTDIEIDSQTGEVSLSKGQVNIRVAAVPDVGNKQPSSDAWNEAFEQKYHIPDFDDDAEHLKDTHDNPFALPANRIAPPLFEVTMTAASDSKAKALSYALQTTYALDTTASGNTIVASDVMDPIALLNEVGVYGVEGEVTNGPDLLDFAPGTKVAVMADYPDMGYLADDRWPERAMVLGRYGEEILCKHAEWGAFYATEGEIIPLRVWEENYGK